MIDAATPAVLPLPREPLPRELVKEIAMEIGKEVASHIETMYPAAVTAASTTMLLSLRNCVHNNVMAAVDALDAGDAVAWLEQRREHRRRQRAAYRKLRKETFIEGSAADHECES